MARLQEAPCRLASYLGACVEEDAWAWVPSYSVLEGAALVLQVHDLVGRGPTPVSYTHLTLPTILRV